MKEQEETLQLQFDKAIEQLTKHIQTTVSEDASQKQPEQPPAEQEPPQQQQQASTSITPDMINLEQIQKHLSLDLPTAGATQEQMAASFIKLLNLTVESTAASSSTPQGGQGSQAAALPRPAPPPPSQSTPPHKLQYRATF